MNITPDRRKVLTQWQTILGRVTGELRTSAESVARAVTERVRVSDPIQIAAYRGFGTARRFHVFGRVLENEGIGIATPTDSLWRNLVHTLKRLESDEVADARVRVRSVGTEQVLTSDAEGFIRGEVRPSSPLTPDRIWHDVSYQLDWPRRTGQAPVTATSAVLVPPASARLGVISDIDDTIVQMDVTHLVRIVRTVFLTNAHTRTPFPGVSAFYQALHGGGSGHDGNPIFYVSNSPWNLYDLLDRYLEIQELPPGPLLLRDWGRASRSRIGTGQRTHKLDTIRQILKLYPQLPFILIGDSGQRDPEIYREIVHRFPRRILAIYIRDVSRSAGRARAIAALTAEVVAQGSTLVLADDTMAAARHAAEHGWIRRESLGAIGKERRADEAAARAEGELETKPTVVIDPDAPAIVD